MSSGLKEAVIELREEDALRITDEELKGGTDPLEIVTACREAMDVIGQRSPTARRSSPSSSWPARSCRGSRPS